MSYKDLLALFKEYRYSPIGYLLGLALVLSISNFLVGYFFDSLVPSNLWYLPYFILSLFYTGAWLYKKYFPPILFGNKVGILVAIYAQNEKDQKKLKVDFIREMRKVNSNNTELTLIELPNHMSEQIHSHKEARKYLDTTGCQFIIWGSYKRRGVGESLNAFDLEALVTHKPIGSKIKENFEREFNETFSRKINFHERIELQAFPLTVEVVFEATKYLLGIALLISGDINRAVKLHESLLTELVNKSNLPPPLNLIKERELRKLCQKNTTR